MEKLRLFCDFGSRYLGLAMKGKSLLLLVYILFTQNIMTLFSPQKTCETIHDPSSDLSHYSCWSLNKIKMKAFSVKY